MFCCFTKIMEAYYDITYIGSKHRAIDIFTLSCIRNLLPTQNIGTYDAMYNNGTLLFLE